MSATVTTSLTGVTTYWLKDTTNPAATARSVRINDFPEIDRPRDSAVYSILDRADPVVQFGSVRRLGRGQFTIWTTTGAEYLAVDAMLSSGNVLSLQTPSERIGDEGTILFFAALRFPAQRPGKVKTPVRFIPVDFVEVATP